MSAALEAQIETLQEQVAYYKSELGLATDAERRGMFRRRWRLTGRESEILDLLYARAGRVITVPQFLNAIYPNGDEPLIKIFTVYVCKLRKKLGDGLIETEWGNGYRLTPAGVAICYQLLNRGALA